MRRLLEVAVFAVLVGLMSAAGAQNCYTYQSLQGCATSPPSRPAPPAKRAATPSLYASSSQLEDSTSSAAGSNEIQFGNTITLPSGQACATIGTRFICR